MVRLGDDDRTAEAAKTEWPGGGRELALVLGEELRVVPLPAQGAVTLGRSSTADVILEDGSASRHHARLHLGAVVELEDLGSANGTFAAGLRLARGARVRLELGGAFRIGRTTLVLRATVDRGLVGADADDAAPVLLSPAMREVAELAAKVARGAISVLVLGETGVGKDVFARLVHERSPRASGPFVVVNCPAISESLWESQLFGNEKGAFTGATSDKVGLLESADGGTVFLDEIGEIPLSIQAKLLRVVEDRCVLRVGAKNPRRIDVRFVAATNRDLEAEVEAGRFRRDLFFRLSGTSLFVPPLRERGEELGPLAERFVRLASEALGRADTGLTEAALARLCAHPWPGNVRELRNVIERAVLIAGPGPIDVEHLALRSEATPPTPKATPPRPDPSATPAGGGPRAVRRPRSGREWAEPSATPAPAEHGSLKDAVLEAERERIVGALAACGGNQTRAAQVLGISRRTLVAKLGHHDVTRPRKPKG